MKQLPFKVSIETSGVRGRNVYQLTPRRQLVRGPSNSLDVVIQQRFVNPSSPYRVRADDAELHPTPSGSYELLIPASGASAAERVPVHFDTRFPKPGDAAAGTYRLRTVFVEGSWF